MYLYGLDDHLREPLRTWKEGITVNRRPEFSAIEEGVCAVLGPEYTRQNSGPLGALIVPWRRH
jgi:hypothetical protein